jgi:hypothetical protein
MYSDAISDELRRVEAEVVQGERRLAEQEALTIDLKRQGLNHSQAEAELQLMREVQRQRQQERLRLLALLQP